MQQYFPPHLHAFFNQVYRGRDTVPPPHGWQHTRVTPQGSHPGQMYGTNRLPPDACVSLHAALLLIADSCLHPSALSWELLSAHLRVYSPGSFAPTCGQGRWLSPSLKEL